jgi:fibronectin type 3 domain-containing protein
MRIGFVPSSVITALALLAGCNSAVAVDKLPETPTGLTLEREEFDPANGKLADKIFLTWDAPADRVKAYRIYRSDQPKDEAESEQREYRLIGTAETNSFTDTDLCSDLGVIAIYYYQVSAVDEVGNESPPSSEVSIQYTRYGLP